jgi:transposase
MAQGWRLGSFDGCRDEGPRRQGSDDRQLDCACASTRLRGQKKSGVRCVGRSRGGLTTKIHARVDANGRPVRLLISPGQDHDATCAQVLLDGLEQRAIVIADKAYDADHIRALIRGQGAIPNIPNKSNRKKRFHWKKAIYRQRNHVERFFNKLKQCRRIATRYDKLGATFFAFIQLAAVRISLRSIESTS